jgi:hypothetical protein
MVENADVPMYLLSLKSFYPKLGTGKVAAIIDRDIPQSLRDTLTQHVPGLEIVILDDIVTGECQRGVHGSISYRCIGANRFLGTSYYAARRQEPGRETVPRLLPAYCFSRGTREDASPLAVVRRLLRWAQCATLSGTPLMKKQGACGRAPIGTHNGESINQVAGAMRQDRDDRQGAI